MNLQVLVPVVFLSSSFLLAQSELSPASVPGSSISSDPGHMIWISGKVAVAGGSAAPDGVNVVLRCAGEERARVTSNVKGDFSIMLGGGAQGPGERQSVSADWGSVMQGCEIDIDSAEYASKPVPLFNAGPEQINDVGTIVLHPHAGTSVETVSVTTLAAPDKAKTNFAKGKEQEKKGKWAAACNSFRRAVQVYPRYAVAWLELGRAQAKQKDFTEARQSFYQATSKDSHLLAGYAELANLALRQQQWTELARVTQDLLRLSPDSSADAWFLNSAANFNLGDVPTAETSAVRGLRIDSRRQVPQLEFLYAVILARKGALESAVAHLETYLQLVPHAGDSGTAAARLKEWKKALDESKSASR